MDTVWTSCPSSGSCSGEAEISLSQLGLLKDPQGLSAGPPVTFLPRGFVPLSSSQADLFLRTIHFSTNSSHSINRRQRFNQEIDNWKKTTFQPPNTCSHKQMSPIHCPFDNPKNTFPCGDPSKMNSGESCYIL